MDNLTTLVLAGVQVFISADVAQFPVKTEVNSKLSNFTLYLNSLLGQLTVSGSFLRHLLNAALVLAILVLNMSGVDLPTICYICPCNDRLIVLRCQLFWC